MHLKDSTYGSMKRLSPSITPWNICWDGIVGYSTLHETYCLCVGNHTGHNLHTRGWGDMKMKGQPNRDSNPVPPSQWNNHATKWANKTGLCGRGVNCWTGGGDVSSFSGQEQFTIYLSGRFADRGGNWGWLYQVSSICVSLWQGC